MLADTERGAWVELEQAFAEVTIALSEGRDPTTLLDRLRVLEATRVRWSDLGREKHERTQRAVTALNFAVSTRHPTGKR